MNDQKGSKGLRNKRALALVLRGRQKVEEEQQREEWQAIQDHFESVSAGDIEMALEEFRNSEKREHRAQAGKLLVAYFLWCWRAQRDWVLRSGSVPKVSEVTPTSKPIATAVSTGARAAEGSLRTPRCRARVRARVDRHRSEPDVLASPWKRMSVSSQRSSVNVWRRSPRTQTRWRITTSCPNGAGQIRLSAG